MVFSLIVEGEICGPNVRFTKHLSVKVKGLLCYRAPQNCYLLVVVIFYLSLSNLKFNDDVQEKIAVL